jgi:predicted regulator of Ras-like GTPase activity (Roadblock/LC7/MglB family)
MANLASIDGVHGAVLYRIDGLVIHTVFSSSVCYELLDLALWMKKTVSRVSEELVGDVSKLVYDRSPYTIPFYRVGRTAILAGITDENANSGLLEIELDRISRSLAEAIEG